MLTSIQIQTEAPVAIVLAGDHHRKLSWQEQALAFEREIDARVMALDTISSRGVDQIATAVANELRDANEAARLFVVAQDEYSRRRQS